MNAPPDNNLISFNGPHHNNLFVEHLEDILPNPKTNDTLKFSTQLTNFKARFGRVYGGTEDAIDINNGCENIEIEADTVVLGGKMGITIKGGARNIRITIHNLIGAGREVDVDLGNWSDQSHEPVQNVTLDITRLNGDPVRVRCINADRPWFAPNSGPYVFLFPSPAIPRALRAKIFEQMRRWGFFR